MRRAKLYVFSGLPGAGKTTLAKRLAAEMQAVYLRIDTVEQGLRDLCGVDVEGEGYRLSYRIAADNLRLGRSVVADSCNPIELTRREWRDVAASCGAGVVDIEIVCSDMNEHRRRIESRTSDIPNLELPSWAQVENREYDGWASERIVVDTAAASADESFQALRSALDGLEG